MWLATRSTFPKGRATLQHKWLAPLRRSLRARAARGTLRPCLLNLLIFSKIVWPATTLKLRGTSATRSTFPKGRAKCGAEGGRTPDLLNANQALSQLSYGPESYWKVRHRRNLQYDSPSEAPVGAKEGNPISFSSAIKSEKAALSQNPNFTDLRGAVY